MNSIIVLAAIGFVCFVLILELATRRRMTKLYGDVTLIWTVQDRLRKGYSDAEIIKYVCKKTRINTMEVRIFVEEQKELLR